jgi:hypothetical protein
MVMDGDGDVPEAREAPAEADPDPDESPYGGWMSLGNHHLEPRRQQHRRNRQRLHRRALRQLHLQVQAAPIFPATPSAPFDQRQRPTGSPLEAGPRLAPEIPRDKPSERATRSPRSHSIFRAKPPR